MIKEEDHNNIDQLLRHHFGEHTILPEEELWNRIDSRMNQKTLPKLKLKRLKIALIGSAALVAGLVFLLTVFRNDATLTPELAKTESVENAFPSTNNSTKTDKSEQAEIEKQKQAIQEKNSQPEVINTTKQIKNNKQLNSAETKPVTERDSIVPERIELLTADHLLTAENKANPLNAFGEKQDSHPVYASAKSKKPAKTRAVNYSKHKNISAKKYFARNSHSGQLNKQGNLLNNLELKMNLSAMYSTRKNNNVQSDPLINYDPSYFNQIEKGRISFNGGLDLGYNINSKWSIYSGVEYSRYSLQIQHAQSNYQFVTPTQILIPSSAGNIHVTGAGLAELSSQSQFETKLRLHYLTIPFVAQFRPGPNWYTSAGIKCEILMSDKSSVSLNDNTVNFSVLKIDGLKKYNWGIVLGFGYENTTPSGFRFEIGPELSYQLTNLNTSAEVISKPIFIGLHTSFYLAKYRRL